MCQVYYITCVKFIIMYLRKEQETKEITRTHKKNKNKQKKKETVKELKVSVAVSYRGCDIKSCDTLYTTHLSIVLWCHHLAF